MRLRAQRLRKPTTLALAAVLGTSLSLSACFGDDADEPPADARRAETVRYVKPIGEQPVRAPRDAESPNAAQPVDPRPTTAPEDPNLLLITVDDAAWRDMEFMPHLQRLLADRGVTLENGTAPTPLCVPARASLLTGKYTHNHGAGSIKGEGGGVTALDDRDTLPVRLQDAGYKTFFLGKYLNGYGRDAEPDYVPPGWTDWRALVDPTTYNFFEPRLSINGRTADFEEYSTTLLSRQSRDLLERQADAAKPWFMWVNYVAPHVGGPTADDDPKRVYPKAKDVVKTTTPEPRDVDAFSDLELPDSPEMFEADPSDKGIVRNARKVVPAQYKEMLTEARQQRVESLQSVDRALAATFRTLRSTGQLEDTYIVFTSDNGYAMGEHNLDGKLWYFRDIVGIPMYIRGPGLSPGTTSSTPVSNADWAPTFAALANARAPRGVDGTDVLPWLESGASRRVIPIEAYPVRGGSRQTYHGVVDGPWTWVRDRKGRTEVYFRDVDPHQLHNLAYDPRYRKQVRQLAKLAKTYRYCSGTECQTPFRR